MERNKEFLTLRYSRRNVERMIAREGVEQLPTSHSDSYLTFRDGEGITLGYIKHLALSGYVGLQAIPRWAVIR